MNHRINSIRQVSRGAFEPCHEVEIRRPIERYWVAVEEVRHDHKKAISSKLIRYQLGVDEFMPNDIRKHENSPACRAIRWVRDVGLN